ncbi:GNAT family N-acetyltransferase [Pseudooceanicola sp. CBS1P-1]|uniref:GNAT family N-acetyltransferase n=1 Tax=Pseudooceanicola albus TaxID=2692189 RepID=A0A6L7FZC1_9RHOB|nr:MULTISPECIES: GNAT family N-acetyltransferase [Pseudooceanicola]MBT9382239.1 GNAT family N-acetyltransferase [Pseudooceanicola endophyticus]MXN16782.1 GNAT family N-acetyltransferase [Pseudooceanicola albus]
MSLLIRPMTVSDHAAVARIFFCAVHEGTRAAYSAAQRRAWAGETIDLPAWQRRLEGMTGFVATRDEEPVGVLTLDAIADAQAHVDLAFVLPSQAGKGIGGQLLRRAEAWARSGGAGHMTTEASLVARPFFARHGWQVVRPEEILRRGVSLRRFRMRKDLEAAAVPAASGGALRPG